MAACIAELPDGKLDVVGDVHGHWHALRDLIARLGYDDHGRHPQQRRLVFVGDLCDRGPDSPAVVDWVLQRIREGRAWAVMGNHELNLLRQERKEGNDWFWDEHTAHDHKFEPFKRLERAKRQAMLDGLAALPLVLARDDLRVVHAGWSDVAVGALQGRSFDGPVGFRALFEEFEDAVRHEAALLQADKAREMASWKPHLHDRTMAVPMLRATAQCDVLHQSGNPVRVLTSGLEQLTQAPHFSSGKWRFTDRQKWWEMYPGPVPVVVGHYWRRPPGSQASAPHKEGKPPDLMAEYRALDWLGPGGKVFCVDYSVAAGGKLAALRWPEREVQFAEV